MTRLTPQYEGHPEPDLISSPLNTRVGGHDVDGNPNWPILDLDKRDENILSWFFKTDVGTYAFIGLVLLGGLILLSVVVLVFMSTI